jgi:hypothetical protein
MKFKNEEEDSEIGGLKIKTKTASGKNSIYVEALESISSKKIKCQWMNSLYYSRSFRISVLPTLGRTLISLNYILPL